MTPIVDETELARLKGLSEAEAAARFRSDGPNELESTKPRSPLAIAGDVMREPMFLLLLAAGGLYALLGEARESALLLGAIVVIIGITFYQERKTERVLEALRDLSSPRALVIRDGRQTRIAGREVVRGDVLILSEGDRVAADARLLWAASLTVDESLLTGESVPVGKHPNHDAARDDAQAQIFAGTLVVAGNAVACVEATGAASAIGRIGQSLRTLTPEATPLQRETRRLVRVFATIGLALSVLVALGYGLLRGDWLHGVLAGLTLAMAILPEEFAVVLVVFLALGAWRIARHRVLTRRMPAVETLGSATVLCVDKTGTLTENRMSVRTLRADGEQLDLPRVPAALPESVHTLVEFAILASQRDPFDPTEQAIRRLGEQTLADTEHLHDEWRLVREYPLSPELLALSHVWQARGGSRYIIAAKGAPEAIADLCHLPPERVAAVTRDVEALAERGLRVLGVARAAFDAPPLPPHQHAFDFVFLGLVGLADPVRPGVPEAIAACRAAGIRVMMITGDHPATARSIAREIGLTDDVVTGPELDALDDETLAARVRTASVFARTVPAQKLRLVQALKANGEIVAMTGDGVNDAPALKSAHIGVAMGARGTDVAREAASLVLLDDDFTSIVRAVRLGRRVADNLRKAMAYIIAVHVPVVGLSVVPVALGWPLILTPVHIVFLELIIDPACSIVFEAEPEEPDVMRRRPRDPSRPLFDARTMGISLLQGLGVLAIVLSIFAVILVRDLNEMEARALGFATLVFANLALIFTNRSWRESVIAGLKRRNAALWWVVGGTLAVLALTLAVPALRAMFGFAPLHAPDVAFALVAGVAGILWFEAYKVLRR